MGRNGMGRVQDGCQTRECGGDSSVRAGFLPARGRRLRSFFLPPLAVAAALLVRWPLAGQSTAGAAPGTERLATLLAEPVPGPAVQAEALEQLRRAIEAWDGGTAGTAAHRADSALAAIPALADWRPLVFAELLAPTGDTAGVRSALARVDGADSHLSRWRWAALADAYEGAGDPAGAGRIAREHAGRERSPARAAAAWLRAGRLALEAGATGQAEADLRRALDYGPRYGGARDAAILIDRERWPLDPPDELRLGRALLAARAWEPAHRRLAPYVLDGATPSPADRDELLAALGEALFRLGRYRDTVAALSALTGAQVENELRSPALYWTGRALLRQGEVAASESVLLGLAGSHPDSPWAARGLYSLLTYELETGFGPRARRFLGELVRVGPRGAEMRLAVMELASSDYLAGNYDAVAETFDRYLASGSSTSARQQAGFWAALSHERAGDPGSARERLLGVYGEDPLSFYGALAGERVGAPVLPADLPPGPAPAASGAATEFANAVLRLRAHRLVPTAGSLSFEYERLIEHFDERFGNSYEFAEALIELGLPLQAITLGRRIRAEEGSWNLRLLRIVHPFRHGELIVRAAQARGLDPFFVAGLIRQESGFDAEISSRSGAWGMMQLMPPTAREVAGNLGIAYSLEGLRDPETNVTLGTSYLASMVRRFDGKPEDILSAYNAGPGRMRTWQGDSTYRDRDVFVEHIPFEETRNYVKLVQAYARVYTALYGCGDFEPCLGLDYPALLEASPLAGGAPNTLRPG